MRMALFAGSVTGPSPATQVPTTVPFASENVAEVISGSPGSKDQPDIQRGRTRDAASVPPAGMVTAGSPIFRLKAEATTEGEEADRSRGADAENGSPPSTHETIIAISIGVSAGSFAKDPKPRAACHFGIRRVSTCSLMARAHGRTFS